MGQFFSRLFVSAYNLSLGSTVRLGGLILIGAIPVVHEWGHMPEDSYFAWLNTFKKDGWLFVWLGLFLLKIIWDLWANGEITKNARNSLLRVHGTAAGAVERLSTDLRTTGRLSHDRCRIHCTAFLARIKDFARLTLKVDDATSLRATLAVPVEFENQKPKALRVWAYDSPSGPMNYSRLSIPKKRGAEGAVAAFINGSEYTIDDIDKVAPSDGRDRAYKSVFSVPVKSGGKCVAVVNLDCEKESFFQAPEVKQLRALMAPTVNMIGLTLTLKEDGAAYEFPD